MGIFIQRPKVNFRSSFEEIKEASSLQCFVPSFQGSPFLCSKKKIFFKGFLPYMVHGGHLGTAKMPNILKQTFIPPNPRRLNMKYDYNWPRGFRGVV